MATRGKGRQPSGGDKAQSREKLEKIGALWLGTTKKGQGYLSGIVQDAEGNDIRVFILKNGFKQEDKHPDYIVYLSNPFERSEAPKPAEKPSSDKDEIPF